jgi:hypothetical protein
VSGEPHSERPVLPAVYGIPSDRRGLLGWSHVEQRMSEAKVYWIATVSPDGRPHATPVDGLWRDGSLYFSGHPQTRRQRNLAANPAVCVHLESGTDVVTMNGSAHRITVDPDLAEQLAADSRAKYGYGSADLYLDNDVCVFRPVEAFAWSQFPKDMTRWRLTAG